MNIKKQLTKLLADTCGYFTAIILIYSAVVALIHTDASEILLSGVRVMFFFIFSLLFSLAGLVYRMKTISGPVRLLLHFLITILAAYICLILPAALRPSGALVGILFFSLIYFILAGIYALILSILKKKREKKEVYEKKFSK